MPVVPHDIGGDLVSLGTGAAAHQDGAGIVQGMGHGDEIVLAADTADLAAVIQAVRTGRTQQRHHDGGVDEAGLLALGAGDLLATVQLVDVGDVGHADLSGFFLRHAPQLLVHGLRAEEKAGVQDDTATERGTQAVLLDGLARLAVGEVCPDFGAVRAAQHAVGQGDGVPEDAVLLQKRQITRREFTAYQALGQQRIEGRRGDLGADLAGVDQALQARIVVHGALEDAVVIEVAKAVGEHLGGAVKSLIKGLGPAHLVDNGAEVLQYPQFGQHRLEACVLLLPQDAAVSNGIPEGADADLQGAAVGQQAGGVQPDHIVGGVHGR